MDKIVESANAERPVTPEEGSISYSEGSVMTGCTVRGGKIAFRNPALVRGNTFIDCEIDWGSGAAGDCTTCHWGSDGGSGFYRCSLAFKSRHRPLVGCYRWQQRPEAVTARDAHK